MERRIFLWVLAASVLALGAAFLIPGARTPDEHPLLPWDIRVDAAGDATVFGLTLGVSELGRAQALFRAPGKINLFASPSDEYTVEAYFERLDLSGLKADLVLTLDLDEEQAAAMYERGLRVSQLGSGSKRVDLAPEDLRRLSDAPVGHIAYLPATDLDPGLIERRFGSPERVVTEAGGKVVHWLYPGRGLDIAVREEGREVLQYVPPGRFDRLSGPLMPPGEGTPGPGQARPGAR